MKQKFLFCLVTACLLFALTGCNKSSGTVTIKECEVALITDEGTIEDGSCNELAYKGMQQYCDEKGIKSACFYPQNIDKASYLTEIKNAVKSGAKVVICPGNLLDEAVFEAQKQYPQVSFITINGEPHNSDYSDTHLEENAEVIKFAEEEAGFLAGYAAVREGYRYMGFMGGMPEDSVIRYGYGFVQGADYAAIELGEKVYIAYVYANTFTEGIHVKNMAANWFENGIEAIFTCSENMNKSVISAAEELNKDVFVAESNTNTASAAIIFSCTNNISEAVYKSIDEYYNGTFSGGSVKCLTINDSGIGIDMDNAKFKNFSNIEYDAICNSLMNNDIDPYDNTEIATTKELDLVNTQIVYAEYE